MFKYNINFSDYDRSGQIPIDPSKTAERYKIRDASFALDYLPPYQLINSITAQTAGGKGRTQ